MYFASLLIFIFWLASVAAYNPFSTFANQHPFSRQTDVSNLPTLVPLPGSLVRCGDPAHWECMYTLFGGIWCRCVVDIFENGSWRKEENATSVEVLSEIQPGNNETLVSLFEMQCEEKSAAGCVSSGGRGFVCGCHEYNCEGSEDAGDSYLDGSDQEEKWIDGGKDEAEPEFGDSRLTKGGYFRFQRFRFPRCNKPGYHIKCCSNGGAKSQCFCAGDESRCTG